MTDPLTLPPGRHGVQARRMASECADGALRLPTCEHCGTVNYPLRELCRVCLSSELNWQPVPAGGTLLAITVLRHSNEAHYRAQLPLSIGSVQLDAGAIAIVFLDDPQLTAGQRVQVYVRLDATGGAVLGARGLTL